MVFSLFSEGYMAPEVLLNTPYDAEASDVYSAGCCLFYMLNSALPFNTHNVRQMIANQKQSKFVYHPSVRETISVGAKSFLRKLLEPRPSHRPSAAQALNSTFVRTRKVSKK